MGEDEDPQLHGQVASKMAEASETIVTGPRGPSMTKFFLHKADPYGQVTWGLAKKIVFIFIWGR